MEDITLHYHVDVIAKNRQGTSNKAAIKIVKALLKNNKMDVKPEIGKNSNKMIEFYCGRVKRGDLAVFWLESAVCVMEVTGL